MWAPAKHFEQLPLHSLYKEALPGGLSKNCDGAHLKLQLACTPIALGSSTAPCQRLRTQHMDMVGMALSCQRECE
eukprot:s2662_g6.t1